MRNAIAAAGLLAALVGAAAASEPPPPLTFDPFETRSHLLSSRAVATNFSIKVADMQDMAAAAQKKFGADARTIMNGAGKVVTKLKGKVVETAQAKVRVEEVFGMFLVGRRSDEMARFPFLLRVSGTRRHPRDVGETVRNRFKKQAPGLVDFHDFDWVNLWCWSQEAPAVGTQFADAEPRLGPADLCLVRWRGDGKVMLIGALAADGGDWVRDASRPICRSLAARWLQSPEQSVQDHTVDYVACVLVHDPDRGNRGAPDTVVEHLYEVRPDRNLALIH